MAARLVVSLSGLTDAPDVLDRGAALAGELDARGVPLSQLFRPRPAGERLVGWLHERRAVGDAIVLHGYDHAPDPTGARRGVGRRAEFAVLPRHEARLRLIGARRELDRAGLGTDLFVPPRWLASDGTVEALRALGFAVCADETAVRFLRRTDVVRARVLGFRASGERRDLAGGRKAPEGLRVRLLLADVTRTAQRGGLVRLAVRAKDLAKPGRRDAVLTAIDAALALGARPATYAPVPAAA